MSKETYRHEFKYQGRPFALTKRTQSRDASWILETIILGKRIVRSLATNHGVTAEQKAIAEYIKPAMDGKPTGASKLRDGYSKLGVVFGCYREMSLGRTKSKTVNQNIQAFRIVVRRAHGTDGMSDDAVDQLSSSVLTGKLVSDFEDWMAKEAVLKERDPEANKRSVCSYLRSARSVFKALFLQRYPEKGINLPDLDAFMEREVEQPASKAHQRISDQLLMATCDASLALRTKDRPVYMAFLLGLCSLRRGEMAVMKWDWLVTQNGNWCIMLPAPKTKSAVARMVPIDPRVARELESYKVERQVGLNLEEEEYVLPSPRIGQGAHAVSEMGLRAQNVFLRFNEWMRGLGWTTNHTLHELRAHALTMLQDKYDVNVAQAVAGHASPETTQKHYAGQKAIRHVTVNLPLAIGEGQP